MLKEIRTRLALSTATATIALFTIAGTALATQPGQCKFLTQVGVANSPVGAQQMWAATVSGKFGQNWSIWAGAKNKAVFPIGNGLYQAVGKPCFFYAVP